MKKHSVISGLFCVLAVGAGGCSSSDQNPAPDPQQQEHVGTAEQRVIGQILPAAGLGLGAAGVGLGAAGLAGAGLTAGVLPSAFSMWPVGPIGFANGVATMPLAIWSASPIGMLAFDCGGISNLSLTLGTLDASNAFLATPGFNAVPISTAFLGGITAGLSPAILPTTLAGPALLPAASLASPLLSTVAPLSSAFFTPAITANALMFTNLPATAALSPLIVNVGFTWPGTLNLSALNVFAASSASIAAFSASTATTSSLAFTNMLFPLTFMGGVGTLPSALIW